MSREEINKAYEQGLEDAWKAINTIYYMLSTRTRACLQMHCSFQDCTIY